MKESKFKVGDKVRAYWPDAIHSGPIVEIDDSGALILAIKDRDHRRAHPKQCRKLIKKPRRRIWIRFNREGHVCQTIPVATDGFIEFVEVRKKK